MILENVTIEDCQRIGVYVGGGAKLVATGCQFCQNGMHGVYVSEAMTTARLTNCTSHHNKINGVVSNAGAVVDLMGEGTSVHDNEGHGLYARSRDARSRGQGVAEASINVYQPCVLNDMSHGNKLQNIRMKEGGIIQQKESNK